METTSLLLSDSKNELRKETENESQQASGNELSNKFKLCLHERPQSQFTFPFQGELLQVFLHEFVSFLSHLFSFWKIHTLTIANLSLFSLYPSTLGAFHRNG